MGSRRAASRRRLRRWLTPALGLLSALACHKGAAENPPDAGQEPRQFEVRVFSAGYGSVEVNWFDGSAWAAALQPLQLSGAWWTGVFTGTTNAELALKVDGAWYPGGTATYQPGSGAVWLKDGLLFPWDPTAGVRPADELALLTVNLHTYQETDPLQRLDWVAEVIAKGEVDLVAFQECAQRRDAAVAETLYGVWIRDDNMARLISARLAATWGKAYTYYWDWSHYGFDVYEEGAAVLGRSSYPLLDHGTRTISTTDNKSDINSRTAVFGAWQVPDLGRVHLFSTHVSWGDPQAGQLDALKAYADEQAGAGPVQAILAGDYNMGYDSDGYRRMTAGGAWSDAYLAAAPGGAGDATLGADRIDYQFRATSGQLVPILAQRVFLQLSGPEAANRRVSDHLGVLVRYRRKAN